MLSLVEQYMILQHQRRSCICEKDEDEVLDLMDYLWYQMSSGEIEWIDRWLRATGANVGPVTLTELGEQV